MRGTAFEERLRDESAERAAEDVCARDVFAVEYRARGVADFVEGVNVGDRRGDGAELVRERPGERAHGLGAADRAVEEQQRLGPAPGGLVLPLDPVDVQTLLCHSEIV